MTSPSRTHTSWGRKLEALRVQGEGGRTVAGTVRTTLLCAMSEACEVSKWACRTSWVTVRGHTLEMYLYALISRGGSIGQSATVDMQVSLLSAFPLGCGGPHTYTPVWETPCSLRPWIFRWCTLFSV